MLFIFSDYNVLAPVEAILLRRHDAPLTVTRYAAPVTVTCYAAPVTAGNLLSSDVLPIVFIISLNQTFFGM